jgi:hypothetical protein
VAASGASNSTVRTSMFDTTGDPEFALGPFIGALNRAAPLYQSLQANTQARLDFDLLFGTTIPVSGAPASSSTRGAIFDVAGPENFTLSPFLTTLERGAVIYRDLQINPGRRNRFNSRYRTAIPAFGPPPAASLGILFGIDGDLRINIQTLLKSLD